MRLRAVEVDGSDATITAPASPGASNSTQDVPLAVADMQGAVAMPTTPRTNTLATWQRRLVTQEDPFSVHKLASIGYTVTSFALLGAAAVQAMKGNFAIIPPSLEPVVDAFTVSNLVMCIASIRMAFLYRQGDIPSRNAFLGTAVSSLFSGFFMVWISPFAMGDVFYDIGISRLSFAILVGLNGFFILDTLLKQDELIEGRRDRTAEDFEGRVLMDKIGYIFPVAFGMPLIAMTGFLASVAHDRYWFLEQCRFIDDTFAGVNGMQAHIFYQQLSTSLGAAMASLFVTLRDKKLISKNQELAGIALFATPAFVWSVYTTYYFTSSLFLER
ncbi:hypothetical protein ACHAXT_006488 [Thalassiosira profunda]